ncbi:MAG: hypothetical protein B7Y39_03480 [Bdellovibrio sp. 28-41-41]|nr:MAG: hypothetical protein B7Y39_03480 [Bdellovibrio sp. 28-41-41]
MVKVILVLITAVFTLSCKNSSQPNYIVIATEKLNSKAINCHESDTFSKRSGFEILCSEFYRFTQTYTPSVQSLPAFTSLLTGLYPYSHNVRFNSHNSLTPEFKTFPEMAMNLGYRTVFVSSSPPFFRKAGISQGFEIFDDNINPEVGSRNFQDSLRLIMEYIKEADSKPFVAIVQLGDLKFPFKETQTDLGEIRNLSYESQLESFDEKLFNFFQELKKSEIWDNTKIILVGLNGHIANDDEYDPAVINLNSANSQIAMFFKDSKKNQINTKPNSISIVLSLKDIGQMLFNTFKGPEGHETNFSNFSEAEMEEEKKLNPELIVIESGWPKWQQVGSIRSAVLDNSYLFINDKTPRLYNKLTDNLEKSPQPINGATRTQVDLYLQVLASKNFSPFVATSELHKLINDNEALFTKQAMTEKTSEFFDYHYILNKNLELSTNETKLLISKYNLQENPCFAYFSKPFKNDFLKKCKSKKAQFLFNQYILKQPSDKDLRLYFQKNLAIYSVLRKAHLENAKLGLDFIPTQNLKISSIQNYLYQSLKSIIAIQNGDSGSN